MKLYIEPWGEVYNLGIKSTVFIKILNSETNFSQEIFEIKEENDSVTIFLPYGMEIGLYIDNMHMGDLTY
jgi:hypothetical protein